MRKKVSNIKKCIRIMQLGHPRKQWFSIKWKYWYSRKPSLAIISEVTKK